MDDALRLLEAAARYPEAGYRWDDLLTAIQAVVSVRPDWRAEQVLLRLLRSDTPLLMSEGSELPHSMSPREMLKSLAIQALVKWTGPTYLTEIRRVEATTTSRVLATIARASARKAQAAAAPAPGLGVVPKLSGTPMPQSRGQSAGWAGATPTVVRNIVIRSGRGLSYIQAGRSKYASGSRRAKLSVNRLAVRV